MLTNKPNFIKKYKQSIRILPLGILILCLLISCGSDKKEYVNAPLDNETMPSMRDDSVTMLISDSGLIKYKLITKDWEFFENAKDPHWYFPEGIYVEQFDTSFQKQTSLIADTAWNFTLRKLWRLKGNVFIENIQGETFSTDELFWDEKEQKFYSDKYIEIKRPEKLMLKGIGFESNLNMTQYRIFRPHDTDIYFEDKQNTEPQN
ncbi:LPS export ABC transporter periplasmic protein LptC [Dysgonomonas sp. HDW5A]|uniref:LPS export ABC transporter periplasmic protein LptC n=1 Tax=Dysgonomonas sp. HDW5A TaxID=2714926 RepID=UPI00140D218D|nr:LPS export ABC transporter periplasmic protein LptC [Dysgonomonas sp. HDW5A]QIK61030.1 LPS export ABC transporter periplasmic protein LptC [Dysgonomonas sp. HDW5A]